MLSIFNLIIKLILFSNTLFVVLYSKDSMFPNEQPYSHIIDDIYVGNIFSLQSDVIDKVDQVISLVHNPFKDKLLNMKKDVYEILFDDHMDVDIIEYAKQIFPLLNNGKPTLIHCTAGKSRSVGCVIYYIIKRHKMSFEKAYGILNEQRPTADLNFGFYCQFNML